MVKRTKISLANIALGAQCASVATIQNAKRSVTTAGAGFLFANFG
jgi:hypothetical protein